MLPYFFESEKFENNLNLKLSSDNFRHAITVLRMQEKDQLYLVNGRGERALATIQLIEKKQCIVSIAKIETESKRSPALYMAVGFTKNRNRNEWLLEKITEIGVDVIIPLKCMHSEREKFNFERMNQILIAAMIQSQQVFLPELTQALSPEDAIQYFLKQSQGNILMAHCEEGEKRNLIDVCSVNDSLIMIGPEGDFSPEEIKACTEKGAQQISLGPNRLRTETAALYAASIFNQKNYGI